MIPLKYNITKFEDVVACFRHGNAVLSLTDIELDEIECNKEWSSHLTVSETRESQIRIKASSSCKQLKVIAPFLSKGQPVKHERLTAILDHQVKVAFAPLWQSTSRRTVGQSYATGFRFNTCQNLEVKTVNEPASSRIVALLPEVELRVANDGTTINKISQAHGDLSSSGKFDTLTGDVGSYRYRVTQEGDDLKVTIETLEEVKSNSASADQTFYHAFLEAFRWVNGGSPYVHHLMHFRDDYLVEEWCQKPKAKHLKSRLVSSMPDNSNVPLHIKTFIDFALNYPERLKSMKLLLWQYRETLSGRTVTWGDITLLSALNEGLVREILTHHQDLSKSQINRLLAPPSIDSDQRAGTAKARFYKASHALDIHWTTFEPAYELWKKARNPLAHGDYVSIKEWLHSDTFFEVYDSLVNSFNWLALRYIGIPLNKINFNNRHFPL